LSIFAIPEIPETRPKSKLPVQVERDQHAYLFAALFNEFIFLFERLFERDGDFLVDDDYMETSTRSGARCWPRKSIDDDSDSTGVGPAAALQRFERHAVTRSFACDMGLSTKDQDSRAAT
jgi:hypothetical protein